MAASDRPGAVVNLSFDNASRPPSTPFSGPMFHANHPRLLLRLRTKVRDDDLSLQSSYHAAAVPELQ